MAAKLLSPTTWMDRWGCRRRMRRTSTAVRSGAVRCRLPSLVLVAGVKVGMARHGKAQRRRHQGTGAGSITQARWIPSPVTTCPGWERTASWQRPFQASFRPRRRSGVPSTTSSRGASGAREVRTSRPNSSRLSTKADQTPRLSTR
jgi:hypothetical protein